MLKALKIKIILNFI